MGAAIILLRCYRYTITCKDSLFLLSDVDCSSLDLAGVGVSSCHGLLEVSEGIDWQFCFKASAMFSDLATLAITFNLVDFDSFNEPLLLKPCISHDEPSFYEPLPSNARLLCGDGINRLLARLQLLEGVVTSIFDLMRLGFFQNGRIFKVYPSISEDVVVSQGSLNYDCRSKTVVKGSFLALFKGARLHFDSLKSWPDEFNSLGLQRPSSRSCILSHLAVHCASQQGKHHLIECVNPYSLVFELRPLCQCSELCPVVVTVDGDTESMFFGDRLQLLASHDDSSKDGRSIQACCNWLGINFKSKHLELNESKYLELDLSIVQSPLELQPDGEDPGNALSKSEQQVTPKEDFDCSDASLESEGEFNLFECSDEPFS